jgi:rubredoxin
MSGDSEWRCRSCGTIWIADHQQLVCRVCGDEKVALAERPTAPRRKHPNICFGDIILGGLAPPASNSKTLER